MKKKSVVILTLIIAFVGVGGVMFWKYWQEEHAEGKKLYQVANDSLFSYQPEPEENEPTYFEWGELSWEGPDANEDHIKLIISNDVMPYYREFNNFAIEWALYITHPTYAMDISNRENIKGSAPGRLFLNNIASYANRKNDLLLSMYARFRHTIFDIISVEQFHELRLSRLVSELDRAYCYYEKEEGELDTNLLQDTYNALSSDSDVQVEFPSFPSEEEDEEFSEEDNFWAHSFWARRHAENNIHATRAILNDIWAHYMHNAETVVNRSDIHEDILPTDENENYIYQGYYDGQPFYSYSYDLNGKRTGRWIYYDCNNNTIKEECQMENDMIKEHTEYYEGRLYRKSHFENDVLVSSTFYDENEKLHETISYDWADGKLTEYIKSWNNNANGDTIIKQRINHKTEGSYIVKYADGSLKVKGNYSNNLLDGEYKTYYPNGQLHKDEHFEKGKYSGTFICYYPSGEIKEKGTFEKGVLEGEYFFYEKSGEVETVLYKGGKKVSSN